MKKQPQTTGDYGIGQMVHVIHMTEDVSTLNKFYQEVLGGLGYFCPDEPNYLPIEDRYATLWMLGDLCVEVMAPKMPADPAKPVGRFFTKFGQHLHSVGYKVEDLEGLGNRMIERGIYIGKPGGGRLEKMDPDVAYFYPSPKDTAGLMVELCQHDMPNDPRDLDSWSSQVQLWKLHPLTIERFSYVTLGVRELEPAVQVYVDTMQAVPVEEGIDPDLGCRYVTVQLGDCLLQLAAPTDPDSALGRHVAQYGNFIYSLRFKVLDVDSAERWLNSNGVGTHRPRPGLLVTDTADSFGVPFFFSDEEIKGDPFAG
ncbi:hypothetical protein [Nocardioides sp. YIM 152588]|uniref:hypothetical protein n=1 Tax=Nocardioides sp. YIM 152588 TaxID=3158259 RepID=UPI0032E49147